MLAELRPLRLLRTGPLFAAVLGLLATATFLTKAFHIDDVLYLEVARQILRRPWDPYGATVRWEEEPESLFDADFNPPGWSYVLAAAIAVAGEREVVLHLLEGTCVVAAAIGLWQLARLYGVRPLPVTATVILGPAFLPGYNVMLEGPLLALLVWCTYAVVLAVREASWRWVLVGAVLAGVAVFVKYTAAVPLGVLWLWALLRRWRASVFMLGPVLVLLAWSAWSYAVYGRAHPLTILARAQTSQRVPEGIRLWETWGRVHGTLRAYGGVTFLALPALVLFARRNPSAFLVVLLTATVLSWVATQDLEIRTRSKGQGLRRGAPLLYSPYTYAYGFAFLGTAALAGVAATYRLRFSSPSDRTDDALECGGTASAGAVPLPTGGGPQPLPDGPSSGRADAPSEAAGDPPTRQPGDGVGPSREADELTVLFSWWHLALVAFGLLAVPFLAVRHVAIGIVPATLLLMRAVERDDGGSGGLGHWTNAFSAWLAVILGLALADADRRFANWYRAIALNQGRVAVELGKRTGNSAWFFGHWGWVYYAQRAGMKLYDPRYCALKKGDLVIFPVILTWKLEYLERPEVRRALRLAQHLTPRSPNPLRTISREVHYYAGGSWNLPWQASDLPMDDFLIYQVTADVPSLRDKQTGASSSLAVPGGPDRAGPARAGSD